MALYAPAIVDTDLALLGFVLLLTPSGSLPSPRWRWWARAAAATPVVLLLVVTFAPALLDASYQPIAEDQAIEAGGAFDFRGFAGVLLVANQVAVAVTSLAVLVGAGSLAVRFRRARGLERQQLRWMALAAVLMSLAAVVMLAGLATGYPAVVP